MNVGPAPVLSVLVGVFHVGLYVLIRGSANGRLALLLLAACLGAWAGDALGGRLGLDLFRIGDFRPIAASLGACGGIALVTVISVLGSGRSRPTDGAG